jgi:curli biogenesis system outer membrane secretion channel CsgG
MFALVLLSWMVVQTGPGSPQGAPAAPASTTSSTQAASPSSKPSADADPAELLKVKRIYVDSFGDDVISKEMQLMIVSSLVETKRFKVTENRERADAILKGVALEKTSQELHAYGESTAVGGASGGSHGEISGSVVNGNGNISGSSSGGFAAHHAATSDSSVNTETINEARVAIRLVNPDGDVIWTSTQESKGAKYKGASADVAEKCVKQLLHDVEKLQRASAPQGSAAAAAPSADHH